LKVKSYERQGGVFCKKCVSQLSSLRFAKTRSLESPEDRKNRAKNARAKVKADPSETVRKQWDTIKADPVLFEKNRSRLERQCKDAWNNADEETRNRRIKKFMNRKIGRSVGNERMKSLMIDKGLYDGFDSEQLFHGFVPDEINHDLKIIIEYNGDIYHCRPRRYKNPDQYLKIIGRTVGEQWARDKKRLAVFYRFGYTVIVVWESDFHHDEEKQLERIKNEIDRKRGITIPV
jgi:G:T-mismatch repair DNA endonuclease (very short patch repair protein)